jgi:hypothetical protein
MRRLPLLLLPVFCLFLLRWVMPLDRPTAAATVAQPGESGLVLHVVLDSEGTGAHLRTLHWMLRRFAPLRLVATPSWSAHSPAASCMTDVFTLENVSCIAPAPPGEFSLPGFSNEALDRRLLCRFEPDEGLWSNLSWAQRPVNWGFPGGFQTWHRERPFDLAAGDRCVITHAISSPDQFIFDPPAIRTSAAARHAAARLLKQLFPLYDHMHDDDDHHRAEGFEFAFVHWRRGDKLPLCLDKSYISHSHHCWPADRFASWASTLHTNVMRR